ncbi:MAG TPA: F0F1 ATP synthase subunit B [Sphingomicrobium sp.]|nr:F0F1 ATP synthase subunit B [Sphingomicrobium sp.]
MDSSILLLAAQAGEKENLFAGTLYQSGAAIAAFVILLVVLTKYAWGPILKGLQEREEKIKGDLAQAEAAQKAAKQTLADYEKKLAEAHAEARRLIELAKGDAEKVRQRLVGETEAEIARLRERATAEIRQAKTQAVQELYAQAADLSVAIAEKVLQRSIRDADTQALVDRSLRELDEVSA